MNKTIYEQLLKYKENLTSAKKGYVRMSRGEFNDVARIYKDLYGTGLTLSQMNCGHCKLNALKRLAGDFEAYERAMKARADKLAEKKAKAAEKAQKEAKNEDNNNTEEQAKENAGD